jgi:hypothetical protein
MKTIKSFILTASVILICFSGNTIAGNSVKKVGDKTTVYYFHNTRRCPTCLAIENVTIDVLQDEYSEALENGNIVFKTYNAEEDVNKELVKKLNVTGSALIVVNGDEKLDLTSKGFMYALKEPEKLKKALREALNQ